MTPGDTQGTADAEELHSTACRAMRQVLDRLGERWSLLVVTALSKRPRRFNELRRDLQGVSQRMLTLALRNLERDGLVVRTVIPSVPPQVEYELSALGHAFYLEVERVLVWATRHQPEMDAARESYDSKKGQSGERRS